MDEKPITLSIFIREAKDAADANQKCRLSGAYRKILRGYPSTEWERRHVATTPHLVPMGQNAGAWVVEFEVTKKAPPRI